MKHFRLLLLIALACGSTGAANAYRINVLDPPTGQPIFSEPFNFVFTRCTPTSHNGCFSGQNDTGSPITTLELTFPSTAVFSTNPPSACSIVLGTAVLSSCQFLVQNGFQIFYFTGLNIPSDGTAASNFLITEEGIDPGPDPVDNPIIPPVTTFSPTNGIVIPAAVPEPGSIVLLSTGLLIGGFFFARRRGLISAFGTSNFGPR